MAISRGRRRCDGEEDRCFLGSVGNEVCRSGGDVESRTSGDRVFLPIHLDGQRSARDVEELLRLCMAMLLLVRPRWHPLLDDLEVVEAQEFPGVAVGAPTSVRCVGPVNGDDVHAADATDARVTGARYYGTVDPAG